MYDWYYRPTRYTGHPGHELDIQVLASEETWRTPSLLQATDLTNSGVAIFSQVPVPTSNFLLASITPELQTINHDVGQTIA